MTVAVHVDDGPTATGLGEQHAGGRGRVRGRKQFPRSPAREPARDQHLPVGEQGRRVVGPGGVQGAVVVPLPVTGSYSSALARAPPTSGRRRPAPSRRQQRRGVTSRGRCSATRSGARSPVAGSYSSALARSKAPEYPSPPATSTFPLGSSVAVWTARAVFSDAVALQFPVAGSYSSALARTSPSTRGRRRPAPSRSAARSRCGHAGGVQRPGRGPVPGRGVIQLRARHRSAARPLAAGDQHLPAGQQGRGVTGRALFSDPVAVQFPVAGSYSSALARTPLDPSRPRPAPSRSAATSRSDRAGGVQRPGRAPTAGRGVIQLRARQPVEIRGLVHRRPAPSRREQYCRVGFAGDVQRPGRRPRSRRHRRRREQQHPGHRARDHGHEPTQTPHRHHPKRGLTRPVPWNSSTRSPFSPLRRA